MFGTPLEILFSACFREFPDMMSASEGEGDHGKADILTEVA